MTSKNSDYFFSLFLRFVRHSSFSLVVSNSFECTALPARRAAAADFNFIRIQTLYNVSADFSLVDVYRIVQQIHTGRRTRFSAEKFVAVVRVPTNKRHFHL